MSEKNSNQGFHRCFEEYSHHWNKSIVSGSNYHQWRCILISVTKQIFWELGMLLSGRMNVQSQGFDLNYIKINKDVYKNKFLSSFVK